MSESYQETIERKAIKKEKKPLTAWDAIQQVLADSAHARAHSGAHYTEFHAVELLVKAGWEREKAEREVRALLY